jgi:hypothetical protein
MTFLKEQVPHIIVAVIIYVVVIAVGTAFFSAPALVGIGVCFLVERYLTCETVRTWFAQQKQALSNLRKEKTAAAE